MNRIRWIVPALALALMLAAALWVSAGQPAGADPAPAPAEVLAADVKMLLAEADAYVDTENLVPNGATSQTLQVQDYQGRQATRRALLRFNLSGQIPANATITSAVLRLYLVSASSDVTNITLRFVPITSSWV